MNLGEILNMVEMLNMGEMLKISDMLNINCISLTSLNNESNINVNLCLLHKQTNNKWQSFNWRCFFLFPKTVGYLLEACE